MQTTTWAIPASNRFDLSIDASFKQNTMVFHIGNIDRLIITDEDTMRTIELITSIATIPFVEKYLTGSNPMGIFWNQWLD